MKPLKPTYYLCGKVAFVQHPADDELWLKVNPSVIWADCPFCKRPRGVPCKMATKKYALTTHYARRDRAKENRRAFGRAIITAEIRP